MAVALIWIAPAVFGAGGSIALATAAGALTAAGVIVNIAGALALSALSAPSTPEAARPENIQALSKNSASERTGHYGVIKVAGNVVFHRAQDGFSYRVIVHGHGEISEVLQYFLNGEVVTLDAAHFVTEEQYYLARPRVRILSRKGLVPESHYGEISAVWPAWTEDHRLDGLWTSLIICEATDAQNYQAMYPSHEPQLMALAEGRRVFDPRSDAVAFSENLALCIADYLASPDGFNRPDVLDLEDVKEEADICDLMVPLAAGGTEALYRLSGSFLLNERPQEVLSRMLEAGAARIRLKPDGKARLRVGYWRAPRVTLRFADVVEVQELAPGPDLLDRYNHLPARFISHDLGHVEVDAEIWRDAAREAEDGEVLVGEEASLIMCPSHRQARGVMQIRTERDNPRLTVAMTCKPGALQAIYEDVLALDIPELGLTGDFEVASHSLNFDRGNLRTVSLNLRQIDSGAFSLALADQGEVQVVPEPDSSTGVPLPQDVVAAGAGVQASANSFVAGIAVGWEAAPSDALTPHLRVSPAGADNWQDVPVSAGATSATISGLADGSSYDVSLGFVTPGGVSGAPVVIAGVVAAAVTDAPAPPTALVVSDAGSSAALVEMVAASSPGIWKTEILRDAVIVASIYAGPGSAIAFIDTCGAGTFTWSARSVNVSNQSSDSDAGPVTIPIA